MTENVMAVVVVKKCSRYNSEEMKEGTSPWKTVWFKKTFMY